MRFNIWDDSYFLLVFICDELEYFVKLFFFFHNTRIFGKYLLILYIYFLQYYTLIV